MIIDLHTHTFPTRIAARALATMQKDSHAAAFTDGTPEGLLLSMKKAGIDRSVVLPVATNPQKVTSINDISIASVDRQDLIYLGCIHPDMTDPQTELRRLAQAGVKGIKIHPLFQGCDIDDPRYLRILTCAGELGLVTVMHAGYDIGFPGVVHCSPKMIRRAIRSVGDVPLVLAHMGSWRQWEEAAQELCDTKVMIDTAFSLGKITPLPDAPYSKDELQMLTEEAFCRLVRIFGADRVLFGSDSPWGDQGDVLSALRALPLSQKEKEWILGGNAQKLLAL